VVLINVQREFDSRQLLGDHFPQVSLIFQILQADILMTFVLDDHYMVAEQKPCKMEIVSPSRVKGRCVYCSL
jgi:hypothetical protein